MLSSTGRYRRKTVRSGPYGVNPSRFPTASTPRSTRSGTDSVPLPRDAAMSSTVSAPSPATLKMPVTVLTTARSMIVTTSVSQMKTNGESAPRTFNSRGFWNSAVMWLSTCSPEDGADSQHHLLQLGVRGSQLRQHVLDEPFVVAVGEGLVAADRVVFGEPPVVRHAVVRVVAVRRAGGGHHDSADAVGEAGVQHVSGAGDVDRVLTLPGGVLPRRDDRSTSTRGWTPTSGDG